MSYRDRKALALLRELYEQAYQVEGQDGLRVDLDGELCEQIEDVLAKHEQQTTARESGRETVMVIEPVNIMRGLGKSFVDWIARWEEQEMTTPRNHPTNEQKPDRKGKSQT